MSDSATVVRLPRGHISADSVYHELCLLRDDSVEMRQLFEAAGELVHEAVLNALCSADVTDGRDGNRVEAFPYELLEHAPGVSAG